MTEATKIAIVGYGNIGRAVYGAISKNAELYSDVEFGGIITRSPQRVAEERGDSNGIYDMMTDNWEGLDVDVAILCGGSKKDRSSNIISDGNKRIGKRSWR